MNPQRHQQVKRVFLAACELDENQVGAFLDQACADDRELRREVESLLKHHFPTTILGESPEDATAAKIRRPAPPLPVDPNATTDSRSRGGSKPAERFLPGTVFAGRYRILGLLGRGGMGEVYRADDLKLDQPVALKFLSHGRADDAAWLARFYNEVRLARRVTHPNVCRVYDIGEAEGEAFISMEYVDGEDLGSSLRRMGRFSGEKTIQVARQLCAALGAAHDQGVLHRDLKPANIMIDGRGRVRITDFGIAALASAAGEEIPMAGTPAFMAPELFQGEQPSVGSDLYSLGIVLYELATGREPFDGLPPNRRDRQAMPVAPSAAGSQIEPALERVILQCLEPDPRRRPQSTYAVMAALPGGDPLAAAIAAGETPSPSMVATAGTHAGMRLGWASACLAVALAGLLAVVLLADRTFFLPQAGLKKSPAVLADKAQQMIRSLGHGSGRPGQMQGFAIDRGYLDYAMAEDERHLTWAGLPDSRPPAIFYWYRQGDTRLLPPAPFGEPALLRKLPAEPGMITVRLDGRGRLLRFAAAPMPSAVESSPAAPADWSELFRLAELDIGDFQPVAATEKPPMFADRVMAWKGVCPENPQVPIRVEGASLGGRVVYFDLVPPWQQPGAARTAGPPSRMPSRTFAVRFALYLAALLGGVVLAWRNLRLGRGDQRGAKRLALLVLVLGLLDWLVGQRHVAVFVEEAAAFYLWTARAIFAAAATWIIYLAAEPYVRRFWPQTMITWSRLLVGRFRDPLVGRDVLLGGIFGIAMVLVLQLDCLLPAWLGAPQPVPKLPGAGYELGELLGLRYKLGMVIDILLNSMALGLVFLVLMLLLRMLLRIPRLAAVAFFGLLSAAYAGVSAYDTFLPWTTSAVLALAVVLVLTRVGLVAVIVGQFVRALLMVNPITSDLAAWYAPAGNFAVVVAVMLLFYGFYTALPGRSIAGQRPLPNR